MLFCLCSVELCVYSVQVLLADDSVAAVAPGMPAAYWTATSQYAVSSRPQTQGASTIKPKYFQIEWLSRTAFSFF